MHVVCCFLTNLGIFFAFDKSFILSKDLKVSYKHTNTELMMARRVGRSDIVFFMMKLHLQLETN